MTDDLESITLREYVDKIFALNNVALEKAFALNNVAINKTEEVINTKLESLAKDIANFTTFKDKFIGFMIGVTLLNGIIAILISLILKK